MNEPHVGVMLIGRRSSEYLTLEQIAERLKVPVRTVHEWCRRRVHDDRRRSATRVPRRPPLVSCLR
jgi:DNA-directed RNA polymerase specialized sigma24 family protein